MKMRLLTLDKSTTTEMKVFGNLSGENGTETKSFSFKPPASSQTCTISFDPVEALARRPKEYSNATVFFGTSSAYNKNRENGIRVWWEIQHVM